MKHLPLITLLLATAGSLTVEAQVQVDPVAPQSPQAVDAASFSPVCVRLFDTPEGRAALQAYHAARAAGALPAAKTRRLVDIGDTTRFNVRINLLEDVSDQEWRATDFVLKASQILYTDALGNPVGFRLWVDVNDLAIERVRDDEIERMRLALAERTPALSYNPNAGIIENDNLIFGSPPNFDGDGIVDILLTDVEEGSGSGSNNFVLGFFDPNDINPNAAASQTNQADVLYLDTDPGVTSDRSLDKILQTAAHEYQHLIHAAYDADETTFVNEGLSEWATVLNGYPGNSINYLTGPDPTYNTELLSWKSDIKDYERAGLFTSYFADQFGPEIAGRITRAEANGGAGYSAVLLEAVSSRTLPAFLLDFHTTNYVNDPALDPRLGYTLPQRLNIKVDASRSVNGGSETQTDPTTVTVQPGGVEYLVWRTVKDFTFRLNPSSGAAAGRLSVRALLYYPDAAGPVVVELPTGGEQTFEGELERVVVIVAQTDTRFLETTATYSADWLPTDIRFAEVQYDDGTWELFFLPDETATSGYATRFTRPDASGSVVLSQVSLPNYYRSQLAGGPSADLVRDFRFFIWADDGTGAPGDVLFTLDIVDPRAYEDARTNDPLKFLDLDLSPYAEILAGLPDTFFLGATNLGTDANILVVPASTYTGENVSFIRQAGASWRRMWDINLTNGTELREHAVPVRAEFLIDGRPVSTEPAPEAPGFPLLDQNFPNPFPHSTKVRYTLPEATPVRLRVYDLLGREHAVLIDTRQPAGSHEVTIDARDWPSGVYVYVLETPTTRLTRTMAVTR